MDNNTEQRTQPPVAEPGFVGVFDSGLGGTSVLAALVAELPHERFAYFGDTANAPYGDKTEQWVRQRSCSIAEDFMAQGAKAIVIACNTATSAGAATLRERHPGFPIVGIEPALKPAVNAPDHGNILVMATQTTLDLDKFHTLAHTYGESATVFTQACPGLADLVETGQLDSPAMHALLEKLLGPWRQRQIASVVLGCTHYPFVKEQIRAVLGPVNFFDGNVGTALQLRHLLEAAHALAPESQRGSVEFCSSEGGAEVLERYARMYQAALTDRRIS